MLQMVAEFQKASDQPVNDKPTLCEVKENSLRWSLMKEENNEYQDACLDKDMVEVLDACVDMMYILAGTINQHGLQEAFVKGFKRVHKNNMTKVVDGKVIRNSEGKILKPEGYVSVDLSDLV